MEGVRNPRKVSAAKESRQALLARMREAKSKGERLRIEQEEKPVYETVDESEYAKIVQNRLEDDWIVDDTGIGYADDGREIFDDHDEDALEEESGRNKGSKRTLGEKASAKKKKKARLNPDLGPASSSTSLQPSVGRDIRSLFAATASSSSSSKQSKSSTKSSSASQLDPNLDDLLAELDCQQPVKSSRLSHRSSLPVGGRVESHHTSSAPIHFKESEFETKRKHKHKRSSDVSHRSSSRSSRHNEFDDVVEVDRVVVKDKGDKSQRRQAKPSTFRNGGTPRTDSSKNPFRKPIVAESEHPIAGQVDDDDPVMSMEFDDDFSPAIPASDAQQSSTTMVVPIKVKSEPVITEMTVKSAHIATGGWLEAEQQDVKLEPADDEAWAPSFDDEDGDSLLRFFWFDAYEDVRQQPGVVFLFGKINDPDRPGAYISACLRVKDLERRVFILSRQSPIASEDDEVGNGGSAPSLKDVYNEFQQIASKHKIGKFRCKLTTKKYAFQHLDVPDEAEYLEVRYSASYPALPSDLQGETFCRLFGTSTSFLENLLLDLQLRGPCWLSVKKSAPVKPQFSWCQLDYEVSWQGGSNCPLIKLSSLLEQKQQQSDSTKSAGTVKLPPTPPLTLVAVNVKSVTHAKSSHSEIISIGLLIDHRYYLDRPPTKSLFQSHYLVLAPPKDAALPYDLKTRLPSYGSQYQPPMGNWLNSSSYQTTPSTVNKQGGVDVEPNERALLGRFLTRFHKLDPDLVLGHDLFLGSSGQLDLLVERLGANKVAHWHRIGRLRRSTALLSNQLIGNRMWLARNGMPGRLQCDTRLSAREYVRSRTYAFSDLLNQVLQASSSSRRQLPSQLLTALLPSGCQADDDLDQATSELTDMEIDGADLRPLFHKSDSVRELIDFCLSDALLALRLAHQLQALPLAVQISSICGLLLGRALVGGRAERNEALLLHAFNQHGYIVPDPATNTSAGRGKQGAAYCAMDGGHLHGDDDAAPTAGGGRRKPAYSGGLVLEPKKGFYDKYILLLDFNSLYPSIIQEFNICFTTVSRHLVSAPGQSGTGEGETDETGPDLDAIIAQLITSSSSATTKTITGGGITLPTNQPPGLLPTELRRLVESRLSVKKLIAAASSSSADPAQLAAWHTRQLALKLTANSVYGCLGFSASRFCARGLAALVTGLGRAVLMRTRDLVEAMNLEVIYGDTDSIMINTNSTNLAAALNIGEQVRQQVNKHYRLLELDTDGVYASMLLLAKKKYAALSIVNPTASRSASTNAEIQTKQELKGLDIVRRDWSALAIQVGKRVVGALLGRQEAKESLLDRIHGDLRETGEQVKAGSLPLASFVITKMLTKAPEEYADVKSLPHVQVALRLNRGTGAGGDVKAESSTSAARVLFRAGDTVEYIVCDDGSNLPATQRAYSPTELASGLVVNSHPLKIDVQYYLANQIHPVVSRLLAPIDGTSPAQIADCLGLDPKGYRRVAASYHQADDNGDASTNPDNFTSYSTASAWADVDHVMIPCSSDECRRAGGGKIELKGPPGSSSPDNWKVRS